MSGAVLALGANLGDRLQTLRTAAQSLNALPHTQVTSASAVYETEPWGYTDQPRFLNAVVRVETSLSPSALLGACLGIEAALGRVRSFQNAPRVIDIDVLVYEEAVSDTSELQLPHPRIGERAFVLVPLHDLFPDGQVLGFDFAKPMKQAEAHQNDVIRQEETVF